MQRDELERQYWQNEYGNLSSAELSKKISENEQKRNNAERPDIAAAYERQNKYLSQLYREKTVNGGKKQTDSKKNSSVLQSDYSPLTGKGSSLNQMKNRVSGNALQSGSVAISRKNASAYSPVAGANTPLERLKNRVNDAENAEQKSYEQSVRREYDRIVSPLQRDLENKLLAPVSDFNAFLAERRAAAAKEKQEKIKQQEEIRRRTQKQAEEYQVIFDKLSSTLNMMETANEKRPGTYSDKEISVYSARLKNAGKVLADLYEERGEFEKMYGGRARISEREYDRAKTEMNNLVSKRVLPENGISQLQQQLDDSKYRSMGDNIGKKYAEKSYSDGGNAVSDFFNRFGANYSLGKLGTNFNRSGLDYAEKPSVARGYYRDTLNDITEKFLENNKGIAGTGGLINKDLASFAPQFLEQVAYSAFTGLLGTGAGYALGNPKLGAKVGMVVGSGVYSYEQAFGNSFNNLMNVTDFDSAKKLAKDEAVLSSGLEMVDTAFDIATLGYDMLLKRFGKEVAVQASKGGALKVLGQYAANILGEMNQESLQEIISIANERRAKNKDADSGLGGLFLSACDVIDDLANGKSPDELNRVKDAGIAGGRIALVAGGAQLGSNIAFSGALDAGKGRSKITLDDVLAVGPENGPKKAITFENILDVESKDKGPADSINSYERVEFSENNDIMEGKELQYEPSSGAKIKANPEKTTTVLGSYQSDMRHIVNELGNVKSTDFGPQEGGFNVLNVPDDMYKTPEQFWNDVNKPWLDEAIARGDDIVLATKPVGKAVLRKNQYTGEKILTGFGREYYYLLKNGYIYDVATNRMIRK